MSNSASNRSSGGDGVLANLRRLPDAGWIAGVCAGLADYSGWSVKAIRVLFILALIFSGFFPAGLIYIALWYLMDPADGPIGAAQQDRSAGARDPDRNAFRDRPTTISGAEARARFEKLDRRLASMESCIAQDELELRRQFRNLES
ncbi:MAG TPA: PspC domain-containing protein [Solimonas sp.]